MTARLLIMCTTLLALYGCQIESTEFGSADASNGNGSLTLYWSAPVERLNGEPMDFNDVGGYEIRYRGTNSDNYTNVVINNAAVEQYSFDNLANINNLVFEVAVFDANGIYSEFVVAQGS
ncbi:fibronectin type III domain-containing protein [Saccharospirillum sp.]|uniref:fibronectin type III domain-containing protein n=1 Tax=Saccharospirillum sp. TaxID=2033801 RepID=UPI0034A07C6B